MLRRIVHVAILFTFVICLLAPSSHSLAQTPEATAPTPVLPATVTDVTGNEVTVTDVSRIVPLNGDIAEIVWTLGLGANVVGVDISATYPADWVEPLPKIGYQRQLSAEGILSLDPTVVIGTESAGPPEVIEQIRGAGVPVVILPVAVNLDAPVQKITGVAAALGVVEAGEALAAKTQGEIDAALALVANATSKPRVAFLYVRGTTTQMIAGEGTDAGVLIAAAGGIDAGAEAGITDYAPITAESLAAAQPDVFLLLTAGLDSVGGIDGLLEIPGVAQTPAGQNRAVLDYDDLYLLGLTPRAGQALHDLVLGLHPELASATPVAS